MGSNSEEFFSTYPRLSIKVWIEGLNYKLKKNGINVDLLDTLTNFLNDRKQRLVFNGQHPKLANIEAGVPQGFIFESTTFFDIFK